MLFAPAAALWTLGLALVVGLGRLAGEAARRLRQPAVSGELVVGLILGPTVLGAVWPAAQAALFPSAGEGAVARHALERLALVVYFLVAGLEVDLSIVGKVGAKATALATAGLAGPLVVGLGLGLLAADPLVPGGAVSLTSGLALGAVIGVPALLPVRRLLLDLELFRTDIGMVLLGAHSVMEVVGWAGIGLLFAAAAGGWMAAAALAVGLALVAVVGVPILDRAVLWATHRGAWPSAPLGLVLSAGLAGGALVQLVGAPAPVGALTVGVALGRSRHLRDRIRASLDLSLAALLSPVLFAGFGLDVDLRAQGSVALGVGIIAVVSLSRGLSAWVGARTGGLAPRAAAAMGVASSAAGGVAVVMAAEAARAGLLDRTVAIAFGVAAVASSACVPPAMRALLQPRRTPRFVECLDAPAFVGRLDGSSADAAIRQLARALAGVRGLPVQGVTDAVLQRERATSTGMPGGFAVPHAAWPQLVSPLVAVGLCPEGVDFHAPDGTAALVVCLVLTPEGDSTSEAELLADIGRTLHRAEVRDHLRRVRTFQEFFGLVRTGSGGRAST